MDREGDAGQTECVRQRVLVRISLVWPRRASACEGRGLRSSAECIRGGMPSRVPLVHPDVDVCWHAARMMPAWRCGLGARIYRAKHMVLSIVYLRSRDGNVSNAECGPLEVQSFPVNRNRSHRGALNINFVSLYTQHETTPRSPRCAQRQHERQACGATIRRGERARTEVQRCSKE